MTSCPFVTRFVPPRSATSSRGQLGAKALDRFAEDDERGQVMEIRE